VIVLLKLVVSVVAMIILFYHIDLNNLVNLLICIKLEALLIALLFQLIVILLSTYRWKIILNQFFISVSYLNLLYYQWIGYFFNQVLPSSIGGDAFRIFYIKKGTNANLKDCTSSVIIDRIFGLITLILFVIITVPIVYQDIDNELARWGVILLVLISVSAIFSFFVVGSFADFLLKWKAVLFFNKISKLVRKLLLSKDIDFRLVITSIGIHINIILSMVSISYWMNPSINPLYVILIAPIATLLSVIPISIAGWGVRESAIVVGLGYYGVSAETALAISIIYGVVMIIVSLPGVILWSKFGLTKIKKGAW
jgi:uncharacterized protein (TIRG00374 family)